MFVGIVVPVFYIYLYLLLATIWLGLTLGISLAIYDGIRWLCSRLF
jgi:hypothetical protein